MLYFAYGSNLNHYQMKNIRCFGSKYSKTFFLKDYKLIFCHPNKLNKFGYGNIIKKISKTTSTKVSKVGIVKKKSISKTIKSINGEINFPKKLGYIHNF